MKVFDCYYDMVEDGYPHPMPVLHFTGIDQDHDTAHLPVDGFLPYFLVKSESVTPRVEDELMNDSRVLDVRDGGESMRGVDLTKIVLHTPHHVSDVAGTFETTFEADVGFVERAMIDMDFHQAISFPRGEHAPIDVDEIEPADDHKVADYDPHIVYLDIEVEQTEEGTAVISETGTEQARNRIFAVSLYSDYEDTFETLVLGHEGWGVGVEKKVAEDTDAKLFHDERELLQTLCQTIESWGPTILTGWNSQGFDIPYIVNRCLNLDVYDVYDLSPTGDVRDMNGEGSWYNHDLKGVVLFDLLDGYDKTIPSRLDSYSLDAIAGKELDDMEKLDVDEQSEWKENPTRMIEYVNRDTQAVVEINNEVGIV